MQNFTEKQATDNIIHMINHLKSCQDHGIFGKMNLSYIILANYVDYFISSLNKELTSKYSFKQKPINFYEDDKFLSSNNSAGIYFANVKIFNFDMEDIVGSITRFENNRDFIVDHAINLGQKFIEKTEEIIKIFDKFLDEIKESESIINSYFIQYVNVADAKNGIINFNISYKSNNLFHISQIVLDKENYKENFEILKEELTQRLIESENIYIHRKFNDMKRFFLSNDKNVKLTKLTHKELNRILDIPGFNNDIVQNAKIIKELSRDGRIKIHKNILEKVESILVIDKLYEKEVK